MIHKLRSLGADTVVYGLSTIVGRFLTFLLTPLYTNYLAKGELGEVSYLYSLIAVANIVYSFGLESAFFKYASGDSDVKDSVFTHAFGAILLQSLVVTPLLWLFAPSFASSFVFADAGVSLWVIRLSALIIAADALALIPFAALRLERRSRMFAWLKFTTIMVNVGLNVLFVVGMELGALGVFLAGAGSSLFALATASPVIARHLHLGWSAPLMRSMMRFGLPTVPAAFGAVALQIADRPVMRWLLGEEAVGVYQANYRLAIPMMLFVTVFDYAWKPFFLSQPDTDQSKQMFAKILTLASVAMGLILLVVGYSVEYIAAMPFVGGRFINPAYWEGLSVVPVVLLAYAVHGISVVLMVSVYKSGRTGILPMVTGSAAVVNVLANMVLLPVFGIVGGAWATLVAYAVSSGIMVYRTRALWPVPWEWARVAIALGLAGAFVSVPSLLPLEGVLRVVVCVVLLAAYPVLLIFLRVVPFSALADLVTSFIQRLRR